MKYLVLLLVVFSGCRVQVDQIGLKTYIEKTQVAKECDQEISEIPFYDLVNHSGCTDQDCLNHYVERMEQACIREKLRSKQ